MIDVINERNKLFKLLNTLDPKATPLFGKMTPQHMVEHLAMTVTMANGKMPVKLNVPEETAQKTKAAVINTPDEMARGIKSSLLGDEPPPYVYDSLATAIAVLNKELTDFDEYFRLHPDVAPVQHRLGALKYEEWVILYNKHFTHHLKQFGLL